LNKEPHIRDIQFQTTLAGYVHRKLTGQKVLGVGEASGMFPIDSKTNNYDARMLKAFNGKLKAKKIPWKLEGYSAQGADGRRCRRHADRRRR
jgi:sugar (pentulose or hexulose) kinase